MNDADRVAAFPSIAWGAPFQMPLNGETRYICRCCLAAKGLTMARIAGSTFVFHTAAECIAHLASEHPALHQ